MRFSPPAPPKTFQGRGATTKRYLTDRTRQFEESRRKPRITLKSPEMNLVKAYPAITYQSVIGFGAALTEAAGYVFANMDEPARKQFLDMCFTEGGNNYSLCRLSIQSCDFSLVPRPYMGKRDENLATFSIDDDWAYVLPLVKAAQSRRPTLQFLASPWSPPAWAKTNRNMKYGGHLKRNSYDIWARMIARTIADYRKEGVTIGRVTVQNETQARQIWESCLFSAEQEAEFLGKHLKPALEREGLGDVKVLIWDHNKERMLDRAMKVLSTPELARDVDGIAFHWYSGDHFEAVRAARDLVGPSRELIFSEGCDFYSAGDPYWELPHAEHYAHEIIGDLEAGANGIIDWNILLDANGGPNHVGNYCDAPIMYDVETGDLGVRLPFHYIGHFSRFIQPGATRMLTTSYTTDLEVTGFVNPDGSCTMVVLNRFDRDIEFDLNWSSGKTQSRATGIAAPGHSIQTLVW